MFRVQMLPADHGDCLWVEYGRTTKPRLLLIDAGTTGTWKRLRKKILAERHKRGGKLHFEAFVVTHVDADHIGGALKLLEEIELLDVSFGDVWFNGYYHLDGRRPPDILGAKQGEQLSTLIQAWRLKWNRAFRRNAVVVPDRGKLPVVELAGGLKITLLSPTWEKLRALKPKWQAEVVKAGLKAGRAYKAVDEEVRGDVLGVDVRKAAERAFKDDRTEANGSSIAFLAEHEGKVVLFGADAHAETLLQGIARIAARGRPRLPLAAFKVSHHGSRNNTSRELLQALPAKCYLISTNGQQFNHPHQESIARIAVYGPKKKKLIFNCRSKCNKEWDDASRASNWSYQAEYGGSDGYTLDF